MIKHYFLALLILLTPLTAFAADTSFSSNLYRYSINYPANWRIAEHGNGVVVFTAKDASSKKTFTVNIQTIFTKKGGGKYKSIKDLMDDFREQVPMHTQAAKFLERKPFELTEPDGTKLSGEQTTLTFKENGQTLKQWQIMLTSRDGTLFQAWAYRAPLQIFDANQAQAASMLASWVIQ